MDSTSILKRAIQLARRLQTAPRALHRKENKTIAIAATAASMSTNRTNAGTLDFPSPARGISIRGRGSFGN
jgi:hypothetical protein